MTERGVFIGFCWGAAATTWLARLLNSHEDIFCFHAPSFPRFDHFQLAESLTLLDEFFHSKSFGGEYPVAGVTHGVASEWYEALVEHYGESLRCVRKMQSTVVLSHARRRASVPDTYAAWRPEHRDAYHLLVAPEAFDGYRELGYELPQEG